MFLDVIVSSFNTDYANYTQMCFYTVYNMVAIITELTAEQIKNETKHCDYDSENLDIILIHPLKGKSAAI